MASGAGKNDANAEHDSGIGRIRERTIVIGDTLIAIDNIGSIQILDVKRSWALARLGFFVAVGGIAVMMLLNNPYSYRSSEASPNQIIGMMLIGIGLAMIIGNAMQPSRKGLGIGTGDGRIAYVISENQAFLHQLLEFLTLKINTRDEAITASFDITHNTFNTNGGAVALGVNATASGADNSISNTGGGLVIGDGGIASGAGGHAVGANGSVSVTTNAAPPIAATSPPPTAPSPAPQPRPEPVAEAAGDPDDALFADDPPPAPTPAPAPPPPPPPPPPQSAPPAPVRTAAAARTRPHDPLLDGPKTPGQADDDRDWLTTPGGQVVYRPTHEGGGARWGLPLALLLLAGGGGYAGWHFYSQSQASTSVSLIPTPLDAPPGITAASAPSTPADAPLAATPAPVTDAPPAPAEAPATPAAEAPAILDAAPPALPTPALTAEPTSFSPPETIVARASGLRYRASPSAASDVQIIAETRAGGEALLVNARLTQPDGEWYRVAMPDGRAAWFKASLAVPRSRFAETFATGAAPASFAAAAPRILEPAEGVQLPGGPQPVRLAWDGPTDASIYIVEIEAYDAVTKRWIEDPLHKRVTVESMDELAESIPRTGAWRWRVRGVSPAGEQSQFSRWSAFGIRD